ncbi:NINE protein [Pseudomonas sp. PDM14]|uniref:TM2 domain-containing protein n=1 Tax=Pseudomonas sp. PDM14 TaxID=2769288 RepID=UPI0017852FA6|nr:NINE protein [Pseudomonas sp. PDM14]MBD9485303.1 NINE protein [Pseudomonas sp. PDM14]
MEAQPYQVPQSSLLPQTVYCRYCAAQIGPTENICPACSASQNLNAKSKIAAGLLAIFLGGFGIHRFYLGQWWGLFYLLFYWSGVPMLIAWVEAIVFFCTSKARWQAKYGNVKQGSAVLVMVGVFIAVAIVGILAAIAIPAYHDYSKKAEQRAQQIEQSR